MNDALNYLKKHDVRLAKLIASYSEPDFQPHTNYYHELIDSIISQQLSVKAARTIEGRFKDLFDGEFPSPEKILEKDIEQLRAVGLSRPKAGYIQDLARKILDGSVQFDHLDSLTNEGIIAELTSVKGIGEWTVHMFLMFCMGRMNVLAHGDLGIRNGVTKLYGLEQTASPDDVKQIAIKNNWHPYESIACWYVWQSLDNVPKN